MAFPWARGLVQNVRGEDRRSSLWEILCGRKDGQLRGSWGQLPITIDVKANPRTLIRRTMNLSGNSVSDVHMLSKHIITKVQPKFLTDNEWYALDLLGFTGFVPIADRQDDETINMNFLVSQPIVSVNLFLVNCERFMQVLKNSKLRHGDLTRPHVFVINDSPVVIDWAESSYEDDPRPDKRREGDRYWWHYTVEEIIAE